MAARAKELFDDQLAVVKTVRNTDWSAAQIVPSAWFWSPLDSKTPPNGQGLSKPYFPL